MKILLNDQEHATVSCNHLPGDPTTHHSLTITNYGGFLSCREFNRPTENDESQDTTNNNQKLPTLDEFLRHFDIPDRSFGVRAIEVHRKRVLLEECYDFICSQLLKTPNKHHCTPEYHSAQFQQGNPACLTCGANL